MTVHSKGLVLADNKTRTNVIVEEIVPGGNAEKSGKIQVGDIVSRRVRSYPWHSSLHSP